MSRVGLELCAGLAAGEAPWPRVADQAGCQRVGRSASSTPVPSPAAMNAPALTGRARSGYETVGSLEEGASGVGDAGSGSLRVGDELVASRLGGMGVELKLMACLGPGSSAIGTAGGLGFPCRFPSGGLVVQM